MSLLRILLFFFLSSIAAPALAEHTPSFWQALDHAHYIEEGQKGPVVYVFFDPNCPYCHVLYGDLQKPITTGRLRVRFIPVAILFASSAGKAAAILQAAHPLQALNDNEIHFSRSGGEPSGGIAAITPDAQTQRELRYNENLLEMAGSNGVPFLIYRDRNGQLGFIVGLPHESDWPAILQTP